MTRRVTLAPLTSLRFFAAMMVVCNHCFNFDQGYLGVTFFYVLSGFILTFNYEGRVGSWAERRDFWRRRVARIYPTHVLTFLLVLPLVLPDLLRAMTGLRPAVREAFSAGVNLLLLQSWVPLHEVYFGFNAVSWSISDEAFFYAVFPALVVLFARLGMGTVWRVIGVWTTVLVVAALAWTLVFPHAGYTNVPTHYLFYINPAVRLYEFALGIALGLHYLRGSQAPVRLRAELCALALAAGSLLALHYGPLVIAFAWSLFFVPATVVVLSVFARGGGPVSRLLGHPVLVLLGEASFGLYMLHNVVQRYFEAALGSTLAVNTLVAVTSVIASVALHFWFERPMQRLLLRRRRTARLRPA